MSGSVVGVSRRGLDEAFGAEEIRKSNLLLEARLLREQGQEEAVSRFAEAAGIEEQLSAICHNQGLRDKSWVHKFSAASSWAQAGNLYRAIQICDELLAEVGLPDRLRQRIDNYRATMRTRLSHWYADVAQSADA